MTDLNALAVFAKVAEAHSFSEAARRLKMPVSTVSRRIADLETALGVHLLERSTRKLRLTGVGAEVLEHARRGAEIGDAVAAIVSHERAGVSGFLRIGVPPSISDTLIAPLVCAFQTRHPDVRVQVLVTERSIDLVGASVDILFRIGTFKDSALVARSILRYRQQLVASPNYLAGAEPPLAPRDLIRHRLLAFASTKIEHRWVFDSVDGAGREAVTFRPQLAMNDFAGLAAALVAGAGIGHLPPLVEPALIREGRLVEIMPAWRFRSLDLTLVHMGTRHIPRPVRAFADFAAHMAPTLFQNLPN